MKKQNLNRFQKNQSIFDISDKKRNINLNLWDFEGASFFLDKNTYNYEKVNKTQKNQNNVNKINLNTSNNKQKQNINYQINRFSKTNYQSANTSFGKYNLFSDGKKKTKNIKFKNIFYNSNKKSKSKQSSFYNDSLNNSNSKDFNKKFKNIGFINYKKNKPKMNRSVNNSKRKDTKNRFIFAENSENDSIKRLNLNRSLPIKTTSNNYNENETNDTSKNRIKKIFFVV